MINQNTVFDIAISGSGMIGATAACLFAQQGFKVALLDENPLPEWMPHDDHYRVSAINLATKNMFIALDVWDSIVEKRSSPYTRMKVWENQSDAKIQFDAESMNLPELGFIIENNVIVLSLIEKLRQNYNVTIFENTRLTETYIEKKFLSLETDKNQSIQCHLLLGTDGANSKVREICTIGASTFDYQQKAIVTNITTREPHLNTAWQSFLDTGPVALLPLSDGSCSIVWSCDTDFCTQLMAMDDNEFCKQLSIHFAQYLGEIKDCGKRLAFPLVQQHTDTYIAKRTALCGDAAHTTHPLAGLGANIGFMDAASIAQIVSTARQQGKDIGHHSTLRRYERWRRGENALVLESMKGFKRLFGSSRTPIRTARKIGLDLANEITPVKNTLARFAMGLSGDLPEICK